MSEKYFPEFGSTDIHAYREVMKIIEEDGDTERDLGSYTCTDMDRYAIRLYLDNIDKNLVNVKEYSKTVELEEKVGLAIAEILHLDDTKSAYTKSATGSSEAIGMSILVHKSIWERNRSSIAGKPNIVFCNDAHLCWQKFANYFGVEVREVKLLDNGGFPIDDYIQCIDENTVCAVAIAGSTYTGKCDPVEELCQEIKEVNRVKGIDVGVHVDAAIGGFILPFSVQAQNYCWDFKNPLVRSINMSNHKFGLVYPGLGWMVCRSKEYVSSDLEFSGHYLSGPSNSFSLSFSRPASHVVAQYYNFIRYGIKGYEDIAARCSSTANILRSLLKATGVFDVISEVMLPVVVFRFIDPPGYGIENFVDRLRGYGWMLPCYSLKNKKNDMVMRVVVRHSFRISELKKLVEDMMSCHSILSGGVRNVSQ